MSRVYNYYGLLSPTVKGGSVSVRNANRNAKRPDNRGMGQLECNAPDYLEYVRRVPGWKPDDAQRQETVERRGVVERGVQKRQEALTRRIEGQERQRLIEYRAAVYGVGRATPPEETKKRRRQPPSLRPEEEQAVEISRYRLMMKRLRERG